MIHCYSVGRSWSCSANSVSHYKFSIRCWALSKQILDHRRISVEDVYTEDMGTRKDARQASKTELLSSYSSRNKEKLDLPLTCMHADWLTDTCLLTCEKYFRAKRQEPWDADLYQLTYLEWIQPALSLVLDAILSLLHSRS